MRVRGLMAVAAIAVIGLSGCSGKSGSGGGSAGGAGNPAMVPTTASAGPGAMADQPFGTACSAVPTDPSNPGSFDAMAKVPVATAASGNPVLSTLVSAVGMAGLGDSLNSASGITVFAPYNGAFAKIPSGTLNTVLANQDKLKQVLTYHVVPRRLSPDQLSGTFKTLEGSTLTVAGSGTDFTVNGNAKVICGNVQTANATVYIVDTVLMPTG
jgi:uncharacterized surface protein with fasciclin (FAS1) repeats